MKNKENEEQAQTEISFEAAFSRLDQILEKMNSGSVSLDDSLKLFEEANSLINICNERLNKAEKKIQILVKGRNGELPLGADQKPITQEFK
jgi:exodeoxyribonuclease VII small subunit